MTALQFQRHFIAVMAKHLPPSGARLRLLDLDGRAGASLAGGRDDLELMRQSAADFSAPARPPDCFDAVVAYDIDLPPPLLSAVLRVLRPGGRFIAVQPRARVSESQLRLLESSGFIRILIEPALDGIGVLLRGEKRHQSADTAARIQAVAGAESDLLALPQFKGRYLHLLIQQRPAKPVWQLAKSEKITWRAAAVVDDAPGAPQPRLLTFSSLPKAVAFMQPAVLAGVIRDINKVGRFSRQTAGRWHWGMLLNPTLATIQGATLLYVDIDPATAAAPIE